uniref:Uncharacterized protein n=1 Tax=Arundo donax TaxID=35708 RepID=A0A0A9A472_ARUDO
MFASLLSLTVLCCMFVKCRQNCYNSGLDIAFC